MKNWLEEPRVGNENLYYALSMTNILNNYKPNTVQQCPKITNNNK